MNILIAAHFFDPYSQVGGKRMTSLALYFAEHGHQVFVVKARNEEYGDHLLKSTLKHSNIKIYSIRHSCKNGIAKKILRIPDYWTACSQILISNRIDCLFISAGPFNYFAIAQKVKMKYPEVKCILDFRDLLNDTQCQAGKVTFLQKVGFLMDLRTERKAVAAADLCLTVTDTMNAYYQKRYPAFQSKFRVVMNGYDNVTLSPETISQIQEFKNYARADESKLSVAIFGKFGFYDSNYNAMLAGEIRTMADSGYDVQIFQFGVQEDSLRAAMQKVNMDSHYQYVSSDGYKNDIIKLQKYDVVMTSSPSREAIGTKIFDYIFVGRPIVTVIPFYDSELGNLTRQFKNGFVCTNPEEFHQAFTELLKLNPCILDEDCEKAKKYGRTKQFDNLNLLLKELNSNEGRCLLK